MDAVSYLREDLRWAHEFLETLMKDVTPEQLAWQPPGIANPIGATYVHAICSEDAVLNGLLLGDRPPLYESTWQGKTGISKPQWYSEPHWAREVEVNLPQAREYAQAVYRASEDYLDSLKPEDLERELDLTDRDFGMRTLAWVFSSLLISHMHNMIGEISALKGLQGAKGYPW